MIGALADPEALLVFGTIVTATSWACRRRESERSASSSAYITPFGLVKQISLPRDVVERAVERLKEAGCWRFSPTTNVGTRAGGSTRLPWLL